MHKEQQTYLNKLKVAQSTELAFIGGDITLTMMVIALNSYVIRHANNFRDLQSSIFIVAFDFLSLAFLGQDYIKHRRNWNKINSEIINIAQDHESNEIL